MKSHSTGWTSILTEGGDLTRHMAHFYRAVGKMRHVRTFAILLNGDFSGDIGQTKALLDRH
ncbi:hypothetical protein [Thiolapillus sp.]|uniref:hypothetical protein n=1 Tax=Thiolapillus sp. TaxID=2017437 RepID=UPI003AF860B2